MSQPSQSTGQTPHDPLDLPPAGGGVPNGDTTGSKPSSRKPSIISKSSQTVPPIINSRSNVATHDPAIQTHEMVPLPSNLQSLIPLLKANPSVKFDDDGAQERSRRFTISSQPSAVNLTGQPQPQPQHQIHQPGVLRNASLLKQRKDSTDGLSFLPNIQTKIQSNMSSTNSSRVQSPDMVSSRLTLSPLDGKQKRLKSPTPPPVIEERSSPLQAVASNQLPLSLNESSRRNSKTDPINISRKNSVKKILKKIIVASPVGPPVPFQQFLTFEDDGKFHILLACTGSVATIKVPMIIDNYSKFMVPIKFPFN
jgi:phosphopantothenoylcysteine decarboxylase